MVDIFPDLLRRILLGSKQFHDAVSLHLAAKGDNIA